VKEFRKSVYTFAVVMLKPHVFCFLADRTNGRAYATVLSLSVVCRLSVCDVMYCG